MEDLVIEFRNEAAGIVDDVQQKLILSEQTTGQNDLIDDIFRGVHTLKGSSRMFGFEEIEKITHQLENIFDEIRRGSKRLDKGTISMALSVMDMVKSILEGDYNKDEYYRLYNLLQNGEISQANNEDQKNAAKFYQVFYHPLPNVYERGIRPLAIFDELKEIGDVVIIELYRGSSDTEQEKNKHFDTRYEILISQTKEEEEIEDIFLFMDEEEFIIHSIDISKDDYRSEIDKNLEKAIVADKHPDKKCLKERQEMIDKLIKSTKSSNPSSTKVTTDTLEPIDRKPNVEVKSSLDYINVKLERLDEMMKLMSELVSIKAELNYYASQINNPFLSRSVERLDKISTKFKDNAFSMRLVPLSVLALKIQRLVRDNSEKLGKKINLITEGLDTEIDKSIISEIDGPLMHIIQNAIDHGLETQEERIKQGKQPEGVLKIVSFYAGANVFIQIQDDGKGLNLGLIRQKALEKGLITEEDTLTEQETIDLIFAPGFTTNTRTTAYSGRGVGLDVVMNNLRQLRGSIEVTTEAGLGTAFSLRLPLSLSIIDVFHIKVGSINYLLPHNEVVNCLNLRLNSDTVQMDGYNVKYEDKLIPHINLMDFFEERTPEEKLEDEPSIIILNKNDQYLSVEVERIIGEDQLVVKPIDEALASLDYLAGVSVLGNGELAYLIDSLKLKAYSNASLKKNAKKASSI